MVRIAAAFGIVLFHSGASGSALGYSGLIAFTALATHFAAGDTGKLARRLLVPWAFWTVFYLVWRFAADGSPFHDGMNPVQSILYGSHLWFLPFIFAANLLAARLNPHLCALLAFALLAASPPWRGVQLDAAVPLAQYLHAIPAALLGVAFRERLGLLIGGLGLLLCLVLNVDGVSLPYAVGGGAVIAAIMLPHLPYKVEAVSACMMGVYLVHIAALGVFNRITGPATLATVVLAFLASLAGVWLCRRIIPRSKAILG
ncbi:hypothetical protein [Porphyrobacter sp. YT40]|uniref:hypothetical protein n=1 Tax=Porphyrobacter sp. YT40 TaxID=2547601 RepID=UPI001141614D|nr:hypothetical protein [Porphyrobacter sp. YT40]QDH33906.1 hypothetical protein E2E27_05900 [Porphyrobacter sp. YT40]